MARTKTNERANCLVAADTASPDKPLAPVCASSVKPKRDARGRLLPGTASPNPHGRPKAPFANWQRTFESLVSAKDFAAVVKRLVEDAKLGNRYAQKLLLDKLLPARVNVDQTVDIVNNLPVAIEALLLDARALTAELDLDTAHLPGLAPPLCIEATMEPDAQVQE